MKNYQIKNNQLVINYGNNQLGNACTPTDYTGFQPDVTTPTIYYSGHDWSCVQAPAQKEERIPISTKTTQLKKRSAFKRFFGIK